MLRKRRAISIHSSSKNHRPSIFAAQRLDSVPSLVQEESDEDEEEVVGKDTRQHAPVRKSFYSRYTVHVLRDRDDYGDGENAVDDYDADDTSSNFTFSQSITKSRLDFKSRSKQFTKSAENLATSYFWQSHFAAVIYLIIILSFYTGHYRLLELIPLAIAIRVKLILLKWYKFYKYSKKTKKKKKSKFFLFYTALRPWIEFSTVSEFQRNVRLTALGVVLDSVQSYMRQIQKEINATESGTLEEWFEKKNSRRQNKVMEYLSNSIGGSITSRGSKGAQSIRPSLSHRSSGSMFLSRRRNATV